MAAETRGDVPGPVDLPRLVSRARGQRIAWTATSQDLNVNLIILERDERIEAHRNDEVDVLMIGIEGSGKIIIDGAASRVTPDTAIIVPRGSTRSVTVLRPPFAYLTCHRQRREIWPSPGGRRDRGEETVTDAG